MHHYLAGAAQFTVRSDHSALQWLQKFRNPDGKLARWIQRLESYNYVLEYSQMTHADALSRYAYPTSDLRPCGPDCPKCSRMEEKELGLAHRDAAVNLVAALPAPDWSNNELRAAPRLDQGIKIVLTALMEGAERPSRDSAEAYSWEAHCLWQQWQSLSIRSGLVYRLWHHVS